AFDGRPVIGIASTWSELAPCNAHLNRVAESVKRGVWQTGGFPLEFPVMATGETLMRPTAMFYRNLLAMQAEELIRANPLDGVVLLSGCDKTTPGLLMGAASVDLPAIMVTGGPMLNGKFRGQDVGSGTHVWKFEEDLKAGRMTQDEVFEAEGCMARSNGHCMTMGTASTMACVAEALGMQLPGSATWPAVDMRRFEVAQEAGRRIVGMVEEDLRPSAVMTRAAFGNSIRANAAIGGSTNAIIHLMAIAGRLGVELSLDDFDELARQVSTVVDLMPSGRFLMEDFCYAGGAAGRAARPGRRRSARRRRADRHRAVHGCERRDRGVLEPRGDPPAGRADAAGRLRHRGAARQPGSGRRRRQAVRCVAGVAAAYRAGRRL